MSKKLFIRGTLLLTAAGLLNRLIGFFYRIFLSHTIGAHGLGIFQLAIPLQLLAISICSSGIQTAISRLTASAGIRKDSGYAGDYFIAGTIFSAAFSFLSAWILYTYADFWAVRFLKEPQTAALIQLLSFSIPLSTLHACVNSYYFGKKQASFPAGVQLLEQIFRVGGCYLIYLVTLSQNRTVTPLIAAGGNLIGEAAAAFISLSGVSMYFHRIHYTFFGIKKAGQIFKDLFEISVPLTVNKVLLTMLNSTEVIMIPSRLQMYGLDSKEALSIYGIFTGMALPLILFPATVMNSAAVMLLPSIAELHALGYRKRIRCVIQQIFGVCLILGCFCTILFIFAGDFLGIFLFHSKTAGIYIRTMSYICPFLYLNIALTSILNGLGKSRACLMHSILSVCIRAYFVLSVIPEIGMRGYLYGLLCGELTLTILHMNTLRAISYCSLRSQ